MLLTNNKILVNSALKNYNNFKVPTCFVEAKKTKRYYTNEHKEDLDIKTSVNKIGEIVNLSQYLNSVMWDNIFKTKTNVEENLDIYYDICKLAVLSGLCIDSAKKEFELNFAKEIGKLKQKYEIIKDNKRIKPMFFKSITTENGYKLSPNCRYINFDTPMDYLQSELRKKTFSRYKKPEIYYSWADIVIKPDLNQYDKTSYNKRDKIIEILKDTMNEILSVYSLSDKKQYSILEIQNNGLLKANELNDNRLTTYLLMKILNDESYTYISKLLFSLLFGFKDNKSAFEMIKENKGEIYEIIETEKDDGIISLYDFHFAKSKF